MGDVGSRFHEPPTTRRNSIYACLDPTVPGRYDSEYEERGLDYPVGYVRWTERRNLRSFVELVASGRLDVKGLITAPLSDRRTPRRPMRQLISASASPLAMIITYEPTSLPAPKPQRRARGHPTSATPSIGLIGTGSFAQGTVAPGLQRAGFRLTAVPALLDARPTRQRINSQSTALLSPDRDPGRSVDRGRGDRYPPCHPRRLCDRGIEERQGGVRREAGVSHMGRARGTSG